LDTFDNVSRIMKEKRISQRDLAEYLHVTEFRVSHWKNGRSESYMKYMPQIAEFLGVQVGEIFAGEQKDPVISFDDGKAKILYDKLLNAGIDVCELSVTQIDRIVALAKAGLDK